MTILFAGRNGRTPIAGFAAFLLLLTLVRAETITLDYDFRTGANGWTPIFANYPPGQEVFYELEAMIAPLPAELGVAGTGYMVKGNNHSDDLQMLLKRKIGPVEGIVAGRAYWVDFSIDLASNAPSECFGVGGAPGEGVAVRVAAWSTEPTGVQRSGDGNYRLSTDIQNGSLQFPDTRIGNIANGIPCGGNVEYRLLTRNGRHVLPVTANSAGEIWAVFGTHSGFEATTRVYYTNVRITLTPFDADTSSRLVNLSGRAETSAALGPIIGGFVVAGSSPRQMLIRGVGPALRRFGVDRTLNDPMLEVFDSNQQSALHNDNWGDNFRSGALREMFERVGAFSFADGSKDSALLVTLQPGLYTAVLRGLDSQDAGVGLVEIYDADGPNDARLSNLSIRAHVGVGENAVFPGLVIRGTEAQKLLFRAVGPSLASFGVSDPLPDPTIRLRAGEAVLDLNDHWESTNADAIKDAAKKVGAFDLPSGSKDAALLVTLPAGSYTLQVEDTAGRSGTALVEVYRVP